MSYFSGQITTENKNKGERCLGEDACMSTAGKPLFKHEWQGREIEEICFGSERQTACPLHVTKPGSTPEYLLGLVDFAIDKRTLKEAGAAFTYPDTFTSREWIAMKMLTSSNAVIEVKERRRQEREAEERRKRAAMEAELKRIAGRR